MLHLRTNQIAPFFYVGEQLAARHRHVAFLSASVMRAAMRSEPSASYSARSVQPPTDVNDAIVRAQQRRKPERVKWSIVILVEKTGRASMAFLRYGFRDGRSLHFARPPGPASQGGGLLVMHMDAFHRQSACSADVRRRNTTPRHMSPEPCGADRREDSTLTGRAADRRSARMIRPTWGLRPTRRPAISSRSQLRLDVVATTPRVRAPKCRCQSPRHLHCPLHCKPTEDELVVVSNLAQREAAAGRCNNRSTST